MRRLEEQGDEGTESAEGHDSAGGKPRGRDKLGGRESPGTRCPAHRRGAAPQESLQRIPAVELKDSARSDAAGGDVSGGGDRDMGGRADPGVGIPRDGAWITCYRGRCGAWERRVCGARTRPRSAASPSTAKTSHVYRRRYRHNRASCPVVCGLCPPQIWASEEGSRGPLPPAQDLHAHHTAEEVTESHSGTIGAGKSEGIEEARHGEGGRAVGWRDCSRTGAASGEEDCETAREGRAGGGGAGGGVVHPGSACTCGWSGPRVSRRGRADLGGPFATSGSGFHRPSYPPSGVREAAASATTRPTPARAAGLRPAPALPAILPGCPRLSRWGDTAQHGRQSPTPQALQTAGCRGNTPQASRPPMPRGAWWQCHDEHGCGCPEMHACPTAAARDSVWSAAQATPPRELRW